MDAYQYKLVSLSPPRSYSGDSSRVLDDAVKLMNELGHDGYRVTLGVPYGAGVLLVAEKSERLVPGE